MTSNNNVLQFACDDVNNGTDPVLTDVLANNICSSLSPEQFTKMYDSTSLSTSFTIMHFNSRSLPANVSQYQAFLDSLQCQLNVLTFSETWFTPTIANLYKNCFPGHNLFHTSRENRSGGGVAAFICNSYSVVELSFPRKADSFEYLALRLTKTSYNEDILIVVTYRPPNTSSNLFLTDFFEFIEQLELYIKKNTQVFIAGDFNIDLLNQNNNLTSQFLNNMYSNNLVPFINLPTRITDHSATLIDNIFTNSRKIIKSAILQCDISDHFPIFIAVNAETHKKPSETKRISTFSYTFNRNAITRLNYALAQNDWSCV
jgi:hypothetical protein